MNHQEIEQTAKYIEHQAEHGNTASLGAEYALMSGQDKTAIAQQIKDDQMKQPAELPKLDFYENGDIKSYDKKDHVLHEHTEFDKDTQNRTSTHIERWDGEKEDFKYDSKSGRELEVTKTHPDGSSVVDERNPKNEQFKSEVVHNKDGSTDAYFDNKQGEMIHVKKDVSGNVVEADSEKSVKRDFEYDKNGNLEKINGRLGQWQRGTDKSGHEEWTNKDTGKVWKGAFRVDENGSLHFQSEKGSVWVFTNDGKDQREPRK